MPKWEIMTDGEIRTSFRDAKYKEKQIKILSQLTLKTEDEIKSIVGYIPKTNKKRNANRQNKRNGGRPFTDREIAYLIEQRAKGVPYKSICVDLRRSSGALAKKYHKIKNEVGLEEWLTKYYSAGG